MSTETQAGENGVTGTSGDTLTVTDNRTGETYELPITDGTIRGVDLRQIKTDDEDFGLMSYDPAFMNTASCRSSVTYIDGDRGILEYRGYPIDQLAEQATYLEVAYLLVHGELPTGAELDAWVEEITIHTFVHENVKGFMQGFRHDAHPMGMLLGAVGALSTFYPDAKEIQDERQPQDPDDPPDRQDADARRVRVPPLARTAVRISRQRPFLRGQLPRDALQDDGAEVRAGPAAGAGARHPLHPPRRPRAELLDERSALGRLVRCGSLLGGRRRGGRSLRALARRRQRGRAADAATDRANREHSRLHRGREGGRRAPDGLRPPRLQELRPARDDHQEGLRGRLRGHGQEPAARHRNRTREDRARGRLLRHRASSTRTSTSTPA